MKVAVLPIGSVATMHEATLCALNVEGHVAAPALG